MTRPPVPRIQVAGVSSVQEALFCERIGVDGLGFTLELPTGPHDDLTVESAAEIIAACSGRALAVIITYLTDARSACDLVRRAGGKACQFHGGISQEEIRLFRRLCPDALTIACVHITGPEASDEAADLDPELWDAVIFDTLDPITGKRGATGQTHDWRISAHAARRSPVPVILAGGLTPENTARAIAQVRPHGVDTHTGIENPDGARNFEKIAEFVARAREAFALCDSQG